MTTTGADGSLTYERVLQPTLASAWREATGTGITARLLEWPPDVFALVNLVLTRAEAFRFALSPPDRWPPARHPDWARSVEDAARGWSAWAEEQAGEIPGLLAGEWDRLLEGAETPLEDLAAGRDGRLCEALLTLHAIADEACAGVGLALDTSHSEGGVYRGRGRELLMRTGSLARIDPRRLRVMPKVCTPPTGRPSFSRYACVQGPGITAVWHKIPARHRGTDPRSEFATLLLLPWPLHVRASDFRPVEGSVQRLENNPLGFFEFAPAEPLDLDLLDRVLVAARDEVGSVDVVVMPESAVDESEVDAFEAVLQRHGVVFVHAGVRGRPLQPGRFPGNWVHIGVNPMLEKGGAPSSADGPPWFHIRQNKHHRWSLDESQILQYHLGSALHPGIRWWEAMDVPRRAIQFVEVAELTLVTLVCEDLAQNDNIAELIRSVGPTVVITALLDGPQLTSRWAARYASVLADDPGSAVLTLTSYGMVQRSRPHDREPSRCIALWKDPERGVREIQLDPGAHAVLVTVCMNRATRRSVDGRVPVENGTSAFDAAVHQVRAAGPAASARSSPRSTGSAQHLLSAEELTILTGWAEAVSDAAAHAPERVPVVLAEARAGAAWRAALELPDLSPPLAEAMESLDRAVHAIALAKDEPTFDAMLTAAQRDRSRQGLDELVRLVLLAMLEERRTRQPAQS